MRKHLIGILNAGVEELRGEQPYRAIDQCLLADRVLMTTKSLTPDDRRGISAFMHLIWGCAALRVGYQPYGASLHFTTAATEASKSELLRRTPYLMQAQRNLALAILLTCPNASDGTRPLTNVERAEMSRAAKAIDDATEAQARQPRTPDYVHMLALQAEIRFRLGEVSSATVAASRALVILNRTTETTSTLKERCRLLAAGRHPHGLRATVADAYLFGDFDSLNAA